MICQSAINAKNFIYCLTYQGPNETTVYFNDNTGHYHSHLYLLEGAMEVAASEGKVATEADQLETPQVGVVYDIAHTKGKYVTATTGNVGAAMLMINPVPHDRNLNVKVVNTTQDITATDARKTIVCLTGPVTVNGKTLKSTQFAVVFPGNTATLTMEENTLCAIVSE